MSGTGKLCVVCGCDCTGKPRTKHPHGRYFCQPCYERATMQGALLGRRSDLMPG
jgi:hypothetical protein